VTNYELGFKTEFFNRRLRVNGAVFKQIYSDYQYTAVVPVNGAPTRITQNADARINGGEADVSLRLRSGTTLSGGLGFVDARVRQPGGPEDKEKLSNIPRLTWNVGISQNLKIGDGDLDLVANYSWRDEYSTTLATRSDPRDEALASRIESVGLINMSATYRLEGMSFGVFANNLTNEKYYAFISESPPVLRFGGLGLPRIIGARAKFEF
jgi:iron complex outermembrane receptor protein